MGRDFFILAKPVQHFLQLVHGGLQFKTIHDLVNRHAAESEDAMLLSVAFGVADDVLLWPLRYSDKMSVSRMDLRIG